MDAKATYNLILPVGTQVVTRVEVKTPAGEVSCLCGAVGEIVRSPTDNSHTYQIKLPSGVQVNLRRHEISIRKHYQREGLQRSEDVLADYSLYDAVIYRCIVGSRAYELDNAESDVDRRGIYLPAADQHWSLYGVPEQLENNATENARGYALSRRRRVGE